MSTQLKQAVNFSFIRYANCWEDCDVLLQGLQIQPDDNIISIASAGDNSFSFLTTDNVRVHAVDINETQIHLCIFKKTAITFLDYGTYMQLMGFANCINRLAIYDSLKMHLPSATLIWCETQQEAIQNGIAYSGKFENYFKLFRKYILPLVHNSKTIESLFKPKSEEAQTAFYNAKFNTWRWRFLFKIFFSKFIMGRAGRDPVFLNQVKISVSDFIFAKAQTHLQSVACQQNYFLHFIFTGKFLSTLPYYIRPENFNKIKANIHNIEFHVGYVQDITNAKPQYFTHANLSNIFEYMNENIFKTTAISLHKSMATNAKLAYWNLMVDRDLATLSEKFTDIETSNTKIDNGFFYKCFKISVTK